MTPRVLREYQRDAVDAVRKDWADGTVRTGVVLPTGTGKTDVIAKIATDAAAEGQRVLAIAHRAELLDQISARLRMHAPGARVGRVDATHTQRQHRLTVAMVQTLQARVRLGQTRKLPVAPDLVIVDECHHAASDSYLSVLDWAGAMDSVPTLGLTATMVRGDRRGLGDVWENVAYSRDIAWAIEQGFLVRPRGRVVVADHLDLNRAKVTAGDYQNDELGAMVTQDVEQIVTAWAEHAADRLTVAFTPNVASAAALAEGFRAAGVPTGEVYGHTGKAERDRTYADLAAGRIRVLVGVMVTTEGWDCPAVSCVLQARPTRLPGLYQQMVGRGLRQDPNNPAKVDCLVLDVVGASRTQRLTTLIDLDPTADYDQRPIDDLPCEVCRGWVSKAAAMRQTGSEGGLCTCALGEGERDPDGGRRRLIGPATYEDLDLLLQSSRYVWLQTHRGTPFVSLRERTAILWHDRRHDLYRAGHMANRGRKDGTWLSTEPESLEAARQRAEAWIFAQEDSVGNRSASYRRGGNRPSLEQVQAAERLGIVNPASYTRGRLSDEISIAKVSERLQG